MANLINKYVPSFGFHLLDFKDLLSGYTRFGYYKYHSQWVAHLAAYNEQYGSYCYNDDDICIEYSTKNRVRYGFFFKLHKKYLLFENDSCEFYTNFDFSQLLGNISIILVEILDKQTKKTKLIYFCTFDYQMRWLNKFKRRKFWQLAPHSYSPGVGMINIGGNTPPVFLIYELNLSILFVILDDFSIDK